jgi:hypothetical protein
MNFNFSHKHDEEGYRKAIEEGRTWIVLDIWFAEDTEGRLYWEVESDKWFSNKDPLWEVLAYGHGEGKGRDKFEELIKEMQPDEYFCSTYPDGDMNPEVYSKWDEN